MMDVAASGGYYVATAADEIVAHPTTITGSIGVIAMKFNVQGLFEKIGVESRAIKSGDMKDIMTPFRPATAEEIKIMQAIIDQMNGRFIDVIVDGRKPLPREAVVKLADGRIYTAGQALDLKLIDRVGYLDEAIEGVKKSLKLEKASIVVYHRAGSYKGTIYSEAGGKHHDRQHPAPGPGEPDAEGDAVHVPLGTVKKQKLRSWEGKKKTEASPTFSDPLTLSPSACPGSDSGMW